MLRHAYLKVALESTAFPTVQLPVDSYVYQFLSKENMDIVEEYGLHPFMMALQSLERTFADKVFALCDYYMQGKIKGHSRHIYDIYMLLPKIQFTEEYKELVREIRNHRAQMAICPSAQDGVDVVALLNEIVDNGIYRDDYRMITSYFQNHPLDYDVAIGAVKSVIESGIFD